MVFYEVTGRSEPSRSAATSKDLPLSHSHFTPVKVTQSTPSDNVGATKLITLKVPKELKPLPPAPVYSIYLKDSDIQVERPYTPLRGLEQDGEMTFWVKRYENGEVGRWFHRRKVGETVEIRGPVKTLDWEEGRWDEVVLISGGTGITPFYQLLHNVFWGRQVTTPSDGSSVALAPKTHFTLMHASTSPETLPPPMIMDDLRSWAKEYPDELSLKIFVDSKGTDTSNLVTEGRIDGTSIEQVREERRLVDYKTWLGWRRGSPRLAAEKKVLFVVCGPEPMITAIGGPRAIKPVPGETPAGGVLGAMGYTAGQVRKL
ncbi:hypothetical protein FRB99_005419 [Tulasnella sp. 403]|nr:hypothetical protein FRB99_005419 [Tulasnella sp. 403]